MLLRKLLKLDSDLYSFILKDRGRHYKTARIRISHKAIPYSEDYFGRLPGREGMRRRSVSRSLLAFDVMTRLIYRSTMNPAYIGSKVSRSSCMIEFLQVTGSTG